MKRIFTITIVALTLVYLLPFVYGGYGQALTNGLGGIIGDNIIHSPNTESQPEEILYDDPNEVMISVLIDDEVQELPLEQYIMGVVAAEMPASFADEALKAQAVAARTYTIYKKNQVEDGSSPPDSHQGAHVCDDPAHCKAYKELSTEASVMWGDSANLYTDKIKNAVYSTKGEILTYDDEPIVAVFHAASSERTENAEDVWGAHTPYLISVTSPGGDKSPNYLDEHIYTADEFRAIFTSKYPDMNLDSVPYDWFTSSVRGDGGGVISVVLGGVTLKGNTIRETLGLNSTNFKVDTTEDSITIKTTGYGHGVGMSQYGANYLAENARSYQDILELYYQGTSLDNIYE